MSDSQPKWADVWNIDPDWPVSDHERENHALHRILRDLVTELRAQHWPHDCTDQEDFPCCCQECREPWPCTVAAAADRAETRLQDVNERK